MLAGGLVSKVYSRVNAPLMTEVVCKADVEQLTCQRLISYPLPNLCLVSCALPNYWLCALGYCILFIEDEIWDKILLSKYWLRTNSLRGLLVQKAFVQCADELALAQQDKKISKHKPSITNLIFFTFSPSLTLRVSGACISSAVSVYITLNAGRPDFQGAQSILLLNLATTGRRHHKSVKSFRDQKWSKMLFANDWLIYSSTAFQPPLTRNCNMGFLHLQY